ncbi:glycosyl hydrolase family 61-domain-containing protein [Phaeosphaeriaceae sp. PMI808]|nr:glycosyl hydrolase family 61-domain-containing protein [Phaeosphaeriaceae sp. PMI808]
MKTTAALSAIIALTNAHATWQQLWKNGEDLKSTCARLPPSNSPIEDYTSTALQCNVNPAAASGKCSFVAGDTVTIEMHQHNNRDCATEGIGGAHWGPVLAYMGKVEDAASADGSGEFFKVYQNGWKKNPAASQGDNDFWGTKDINYNCGKLDFKIPSDIAPGDYLLRAEAIALHAASSAGGAQHYVTCYQLTVTGSGTLVPKGVKFPAAYSKTGPGLGFSIHANLDSYPMPGPELIASGTEVIPQLLTFGKIAGAPAVGGGNSKLASSTAAVIPASSSAVAVAVTSSDVRVSSKVAASPTSVAKPQKPSGAASTPKASRAPYPVGNNTVLPKPTAPSTPILPSTLATSVRPQPTVGGSTGSIKEWAQCGGSGFTNAGACANGLQCKEWNPYYFQCIKSEGASSGPGSAPAPPAAPENPSAGSPANPPTVPEYPSTDSLGCPSTDSPEYSSAGSPEYPSVGSPAEPSSAPSKPSSAPSKPSGAPAQPSAPAQPEPTSATPAANGPTEKTYTLKTFIAWLEKNSDGASAAMIRRMIEALQ